MPYPKHNIHSTACYYLLKTQQESLNSNQAASRSFRFHSLEFMRLASLVIFLSCDYCSNVFGLTASCVHYFNQTWHLYSSNHFLKRHQQGSLCLCLTEKVCMAMWLEKQSTATHSLNIAINQTGKNIYSSCKNAMDVLLRVKGKVRKRGIHSLYSGLQ